MSFQHFVQCCEMKFWDVVTPVMGNKGPIVRIKSFTSRLKLNKTRYLLILIAIWGTVGFVTGLLFGKVIEMSPLV